MRSCTEFLYPGCWYFINGAANKIDDVLIEQGGLPHVLPPTVHCQPGIFCRIRGDKSKEILIFLVYSMLSGLIEFWPRDRQQLRLQFMT